MTLPRFLVDRPLSTGPFVLDGEEGRHAAAVRRIRAGEPLELTDGLGSVASCSVLATSRAAQELQVHDVWLVPTPLLRLTLVQALAKGGRDEQAVETATEVGVDAVVPWQAARCVVRWDGARAAKGHARWTAAAREATKQSRRARVPVGEPLVTSLPDRAAASDLALVLHEEAADPLVSVGLPAAGEVLVVVGPEGGIVPEELASLVEAGARPVRLGAEVMRTSSAGPAALAWLAAATGRWA